MNQGTFDTIFGIHKDAPPQETIHRCRSSLDGLGFEFHEADIQWLHSHGDLHSCLIYPRNFPLSFANGKGVLPKFALASAWAEYLERLQTISGFTYNGIQLLCPEHQAPDQIRSVADILKDIPGLLNELGLAPDDLPVKELPCLPFVDVLGDRIVGLPAEFMFLGNTSNGLAAGNNLAEALCHGICEILERHALKQLVNGNVPGFPTIPLDDLPLVSPEMRGLVDYFRRQGFQLVVKDCSQGGLYPVLALVILDPASMRIQVSFASDPVFDVALQRCLTEAFQGRRAPHRIMDLSENERNIPWDYINKSSAFAERLIPSVGQPDFKDAFWDINHGHDFFLRFLVARLLRDKRRLYIRDCSSLGFPAYQVYIPGMTTAHKLESEHLRFRQNRLWPILKILFDLENAGLEQIQNCADDIHRHFIDGNRPLGRIFSFYYADLPLSKWLDLRILLAFLHMESSHWERALEALAYTADPRNEQADQETKPLPHQILAFFCRMNLQQLSTPETLNQLRLAFGDTAYGPYLPRLVDGFYADFYLTRYTEPPAKFDGLPIPRCTDLSRCPTCPCREHCYAETLLDIRKNFRKKSRVPDQAKFGREIRDLLSQEPAFHLSKTGTPYDSA